MGLVLVGLNVLAAASFAFAQESAERPAPPPQEFLDRAAEFAKSAPPPQPLRGDHSITGRVVTDSGKPLEGVLVRARSSRRFEFDSVRRPFDDQPPPEDTLERSLRTSIRWWYWRKAETFETRTAADGTFAFDHLAGGRFELEAWRDGFSVEPLGAQWFRTISVPADSSVDFVAIPVIPVRFELRLPDDSMPELAKLQISRIGGGSVSDSQTWSPKAPIVKLPSGDWNVTALISDDRFTRHSEDDGSFASKTTLVTASPKSGGSDAADVQKIDLFGVPGIEGSISFPIDTTFPVLSVVATRLAPGEGADPSLLDWNRPGGNRTRESELAQESEDRSRNFRFGRIEKGRWLVGVFDRRLEAPLATAEVEVGAGVTRIEFKLGSHEARPELRVRVADPDGALLRDCTFHSRRTISLPNGMRSKSDGDPAARRTIDGAFAIESVRLGPDCTLLAHHPRFGTKAIAVPTDAKELAVRFDAPAAPKLRVAGITEHAAGRKVDLEVARADEEDPSFGWPQIRFDASAIAADEIVALGNLQPGSWRVRVLCNTDSSNQFGFRGFQVAEATFELAAGPQEITLPFPELSTLRLAVAAGVKETFSLESATASKAERIRAWQNATPDASGVITFKDLPPGLYEVSASGGRHLAVEVPSPNVVDFVAEAVNALRVVVADPKGALAKAGLRSGDLVVAIDGREFAGRQELEWIRQSLRGDDVTLTVTRRGDPFEVVIKRSFLTEERAAGGRFREASR